MKNLLLISVFLVSSPLWAAKISDPDCKDLDQISEKYTPEYLAVVDGYNKAGKVVASAVDIGGIVTESDAVKKECSKDETAKVSTAQKISTADITDTSTNKKVSSLNPTKAKCREFVALGERYQPLAVLWVAGHSKIGKTQDGEIDEEYLAQPVATLIEECKSAPTASFYDKTKAWLRKHI